jgi:predicted anti-sigma-YlaC factor YlaD
MLSCRELAERADSWLDGELGPMQGLAIRLHLRMCKGCERFMDQMRRTRDLTRAAALAVAKKPGDEAENRRIDAIYQAFRTGKGVD